MLALRWHGLQDNLEPALEVEPKSRLVVRRGARDDEQGDPTERGEDQGQEQEVLAALGHVAGRLAAFVFVPDRRAKLRLLLRQHSRDRALGDPYLKLGCDLDAHLVVVDTTDGPVETAGRDDLVADLERAELLPLHTHLSLPRAHEQHPQQGQHGQDDDELDHCTPSPAASRSSASHLYA